MEEELIVEEVHKYLLSTANTLVFIDDWKILEKYKCNNCSKIALQNNVANCKHMFCSSCSSHFFKKPCPKCINVEITVVTEDKHLKKEMLDLNVECPNKQNGCQEKIPLREYKKHEDKCKFSTKALLPRIYRGQKTEEIFSEMVADLHQVKMIIKEIHGQSKKQCFDQTQLSSSLNVIGDKVQNLTVDIKRMEKQFEARNQFEQEIIERFNKNEKILIDLVSRISDFNMLQVKDTLANKDQLSEIKEQSEEMFAEEDPSSLIFQWKITGFKEHYERFKISPIQKYDIDSQKLCNKKLGLETQLRFYMDWQTVRIYSHSYQHGHLCYHTREFTMMDQSDRATKKHVSITDTPKFGKDPNKINRRGCFVNRILAHISLLDKKYDTYVKDDSILIQLRLIPLNAIYKSVVSNNGTLMWHIENYTFKKQDEVNGYNQFLLSPSFYTSPKGYLVHAQIYLDGNGDSKGKHISVYVYFAMGEFDYLLPWPVNGIIKFYLMDQSESTDNQNVCMEHPFQFQDGQLHGIPNFILQSRADEAKYLKEDSLLLKIEVEI